MKVVIFLSIVFYSFISFGQIKREPRFGDSKKKQISVDASIRKCEEYCESICEIDYCEILKKEKK